VEKVHLNTQSDPQALKREHVFIELRRGWKPRPFKTAMRGKFFRKL